MAWANGRMVEQFFGDWKVRKGTSLEVIKVKSSVSDTLYLMPVKYSSGIWLWIEEQWHCIEMKVSTWNGWYDVIMALCCLSTLGLGVICSGPEIVALSYQVTKASGFMTMENCQDAFRKIILNLNPRQRKASCHSSILLKNCLRGLSKWSPHHRGAHLPKTCHFAVD